MDVVVKRAACSAPPAPLCEGGPRPLVSLAEALVLGLEPCSHYVVHYLAAGLLVEGDHAFAVDVDVVTPVAAEVGGQLVGAYAEVLYEYVEELLGLVFGGLEAPIAEPGLRLELGLTARTYLGGVSCALVVAVPAPPPVVSLLAGEVEVVGVYLLPSL